MKKTEEILNYVSVRNKTELINLERFENNAIKNKETMSWGNLSWGLFFNLLLLSSLWMNVVFVLFFMYF